MTNNISEAEYADCLALDPTVTRSEHFLAY